MKSRTAAVSTQVEERRESSKAEAHPRDESHATVVATHSVRLTAVDFACLGMNQIAYVQRAIVNEVLCWSIHNASGYLLGSAETFAQAWGAVVQNDMAPMRVN